MRRVLFFAVACAVCTVSAADDEWRYEITPYLWAAGQSGEVGTDLFTVEFDASFDDILKNLDAALMFNFSAQNDRWGVNFDTFYVDIGVDAEFERAEISLDVVQSMLSMSGFYKPEAVEQLALHLGARYIDLDNRLDFEGKGPLNISDQLSLGDDWTEAFVGASYTQPLNDKFYMIAYGDFAGFSGKSDSMYQLLLGLNYTLNDVVTFAGGYRAFYVDYATDDLIFDATTQGLYAGVGFRF